VREVEPRWPPVVVVVIGGCRPRCVHKCRQPTFHSMVLDVGCTTDGGNHFSPAELAAAVLAARSDRSRPNATSRKHPVSGTIRSTVHLQPSGRGNTSNSWYGWAVVARNPCSNWYQGDVMGSSGAEHVMGIYQGRAEWSRPNPDRLSISGRLHQSKGFEPLNGTADGSEVLFQSSGEAISEPPVARLGRGSQPVQEVHRALRDSFEHQTAIGSSKSSGAGGALC
jgi:hypothetical protein